jgi:class 3 adenylate cyclase
VIGAYRKCVAKTVARFDGFVAKYMSDGVLIYFGYPRVQRMTPSAPYGPAWRSPKRSASCASESRSRCASRLLSGVSRFQRSRIGGDRDHVVNRQLRHDSFRQRASNAGPHACEPSSHRYCLWMSPIAVRMERTLTTCFHSLAILR